MEVVVDSTEARGLTNVTRGIHHTNEHTLHVTQATVQTGKKSKSKGRSVAPFW